MRFNRIMLATAAVIGSVFAVPGVASAAPAAGSCVGGAFYGRPGSGATVSRGQIIKLSLTVKVVGDMSVPGCATDVLLSGPVDFVSAAPGGAYWPNASSGPTAEVSWNRTVKPGTVLKGTILVRVSANAASGSAINASRVDNLGFTVR
jgi:hypothetical protein